MRTMLPIGTNSDDDGGGLVTLSWVGFDGALYELDVPAGDVERLAAGEPVAGRYGEPRRQSGRDAIAALNARRAQLEAQMDELVDQHPALKAIGRGRVRPG